jgi:hypothetical protein
MSIKLLVLLIAVALLSVLLHDDLLLPVNRVDCDKVVGHDFVWDLVVMHWLDTCLFTEHLVGILIRRLINVVLIKIVTVSLFILGRGLE